MVDPMTFLRRCAMYPASILKGSTDFLGSTLCASFMTVCLTAKPSYGVHYITERMGNTLPRRFDSIKQQSELKIEKRNRAVSLHKETEQPDRDTRSNRKRQQCGPVFYPVFQPPASIKYFKKGLTLSYPRPSSRRG
jgi:hypothetical protein